MFLHTQEMAPVALFAGAEDWEQPNGPSVRNQLDTFMAHRWVGSHKAVKVSEEALALI